MKIGIIDADLLDKGTRFPNLALMKISGYHKGKGDAVIFIDTYDNIPKCDKYYLAKVFSFTKIPDEILQLKSLILGGTGFLPDEKGDLPKEIEHHMPDYTLYENFVLNQINEGYARSHYADYLDYSIGFTTRGCSRKCEFCVNKKYDHAFRHAAVKEFLNPDKKYIYLLDDNILYYPKWKEIFDELDATGKPFQFKQGIDIRLLGTEAKAERLAKAHYHGDYIFAFDHIKDKEIIQQNLRLWRKYSKRTTKLYVLCAYDSQDIKDIINTLERIKILMKYGCIPYLMRYDAYNNSEFKDLYVQLARWCNQPRLFKKMSFRQFCEAHQKLHKTPKTLCKTYKCMIDFEETYPNIAKEYFDLRFEEMNEYL